MVLKQCFFTKETRRCEFDPVISFLVGGIFGFGLLLSGMCRRTEWNYCLSRRGLEPFFDACDACSGFYQLDKSEQWKCVCFKSYSQVLIVVDVDG